MQGNIAGQTQLKKQVFLIATINNLNQVRVRAAGQRITDVC
jgi:hypothetical protein